MTACAHNWETVSRDTRAGRRRCSLCRVLGYAAASNYFRRGVLKVRPLKCRDCGEPATTPFFIGTVEKFFCDLHGDQRKRGAA